jgi:hypothetical protein
MILERVTMGQVARMRNDHESAGTGRGPIIVAALLAALALPGICARATPFPLEEGDDFATGQAAPKLVIDTQGFISPVNSIDWSPRGEWLAAAGSDKVVRIWDVATGRLRSTLRGYDDNAGNGQCYAVRFSPDGRFLLVGVKDFAREGAIRVYDALDSGEIRMLLPAHGNGGAAELAFSGDGNYLVSRGVDGTIVFWDWPARRMIGQVAWSANVAYMGFPTAVPLLVVYDEKGFHAFSARHACELSQLNAAQQGELGPPDVLGQAVAVGQSLRNSLAQIENQFPERGRGSVLRIYPASGANASALVLFGGSSRRENRETH